MSSSIRYWRIEDDWHDRVAVCIASGPSLTQDQVDAIRGRSRVIVVNDNYLKAPWADILFFYDSEWWKWHRARHEFRTFAGLKVTLENCTEVPDPSILRLINRGREGFWPELDGVMTGGNTGYGAIHLAAHKGSPAIILLGYDMKLGERDREHWFGSHPRASAPDRFERVMLPEFPKLAPELAKRNIRVFNCTPGSAIKCWPQLSIEEAFYEAGKIAGVRTAPARSAEDGQSGRDGADHRG